MYYGLLEGKLRIYKDGKSSSIYARKTIITALSHYDDKIYSAHGDGTIVELLADGSKTIKGKLAHTCSPYALAANCNGVLAAGSDRKVAFFNKQGKKSQLFDFSKKDDEYEF